MKTGSNIKKLILFAALLTISAYSNAQTYTLSGKLVSADKAFVPDAVIQLLKSADSSLIKTEFTDEKGNFVFSEVKQGSYLIQTNVLGYQSYLSTVIDLTTSVQLPEISL